MPIITALARLRKIGRPFVSAWTTQDPVSSPLPTPHSDSPSGKLCTCMQLVCLGEVFNYKANISLALVFTYSKYLLSRKFKLPNKDKEINYSH